MSYITEIKVSKQSSSNEINIINELLSKGNYNDILFNSQLINVVVKKITFIEFLYRLNWENCALKYNKNSTYDPSTFSINMTISINEALGFLQFALPEYLKNRMYASIKSVDDIIESMLLLLEESKDDNKDKLTMTKKQFINFFNIKEYKTTWNHDDTTLNFVRNKFIEKDPIIIIDYTNIDDNKLIKPELVPNILKTNDGSNVRLQCIVNIKPSDLQFIDKLINLNPFIKVINVKVDNSNFISIILYIDMYEVKLETFDRFLSILQSTYSIL